MSGRWMTVWRGIFSVHLSVTRRFSVFFGLAMLCLICLTGYLVGDTVLNLSKNALNKDLEQRIAFNEERLSAFRDAALLFAANSYVTNGIIDVVGRAAYLPRELEQMRNTKGLDHAAILDHRGDPITLSNRFPIEQLDADAVRYTIETGRYRLWCNSKSQHVFISAPVNYYNTPQGALILVTEFAGIAGQSNDNTQANEGVMTTVLCGDHVVYSKGVVTSGWTYDFALEADRIRYPLSAMVGLKLKASVTSWRVFKPAVEIAFKLAVVGVIFVIGGSLIARRIERALMDARDQALSASRARSQFLANMSHEIRTPLNGVVGNVDLLLEEHLSAEQKQIAMDVKISGQHLLEILNDILDFSKIDAGRLRIDPQTIDVREIVWAVERTHRGLVDGKNLASVVHISDDVPRYIREDGLRLRQILNNLFSNAIKFTDHGSIRLDVYRDSERLCFAVKDTGIGISREQLPHLFSPFTQVESSSTRRYGGTGLGLSICRDLARLLGGAVEVTSEVGQGSVFTLKIPFTEVNGSDLEQSISSGEIDGEGGAILRVLLAEDNLVNRTLMEKILKGYGHQVSHACDGVEAVARAVEQQFDLILMDCQMPRMDGFEATRQIIMRLGPERPKIVALTANAYKDDREQCLAAGMDDFLTKPINRQSLETIMRSIKRRTASSS
jgi:signal transduction histidine kinase/CheY-like chemotaxis protein